MSVERELYNFIDMPEGVDRRVICPQCDSSRKKKGQKELSIRRVEDGIVYKCWHCGIEGKVKDQLPDHMKKLAPKAIERQPERKKLTVAGVRWLSDRGIDPDVARKAGVFSSVIYSRKANQEVAAIGFPYFNHGEVYASKLRSIENKDFLQAGSCQTFWRVSDLGDLDTVYITEGEIDCLSMMTAGYENVISVPNGAPSSTPTDASGEDRKFRYVWLANDILKNVDKVVLCLDSDAPGKVLRDELARRIGKQKVWLVTLPEGCKDANDVLMQHGKERLREVIEEAQRIPVAGLYEADSFFTDVADLWKNGTTKGRSTGYPSVDSIFTVMPGTLNIVTGVPSSGKSEFLDQVMTNLAENEADFSVAYASFENEPAIHIAKLMQKRTGKHFFVGPNPRMSDDEANEARSWVRSRFVFCYQADGSMATMPDIIERLTVAVSRYGIKAAVIDPVNYIVPDNDKSETQWVSNVLTQLRVFAQAHDVAVFLVAHPAKLQRGDGGKTPIPRGYDISGSAHYVNKADFGLTVHRELDEPGIVQIHCWKVRYGWAGKIGSTNICYDHRTTRYVEPEMPMFDD